MWRRIRLIPFTVKIPDEEKDEGLKARLRAPEARSGILNWALEGARLWQREGLKPPQAVSDATQAYQEEMDVLAAWLADCCVIKKLAEAPAADLYRSYVQWREQNGERPETQTSFGLRLTERGFERVKRRNGWVWYGIGLLACDPCDPCDPNFDIKDSFSGEHICNLEKGVTPVTPVTPPPADAFLSHLGDASQPVGGGNSANEADSGKRKPCADAGYSPVDNFPAGDDAPFPPVDNFPPGASDGARQLWEVLKHVQGSETADRLAQRLVGWNAGGVNIAARELQGHGRASINGAFIGPIHPPTPGADEGRI
jgi:hypothetical protein